MVRRIRAGDAPALARQPAGLFDHPLNQGALRAYLADPRNLVLLASMGSLAVGFLRGTTLGQIHRRRPQMFLYEIGVRRAYRRRGVGRALIRHLLAYCRTHLYDEVFVLTSPSNRAAVQLYRRTGGRTETPGDRMYVYRLGRARRR